MKKRMTVKQNNEFLMHFRNLIKDMRETESLHDATFQDQAAKFAVALDLEKAKNRNTTPIVIYHDALLRVLEGVTSPLVAVGLFAFAHAIRNQEQKEVNKLFSLMLH